MQAKPRTTLVLYETKQNLLYEACQKQISYQNGVYTALQQKQANIIKQLFVFHKSEIITFINYHDSYPL